MRAIHLQQRRVYLVLNSWWGWEPGQTTHRIDVVSFTGRFHRIDVVSFTGRFQDEASSTVLNALKATDSGKQADRKGESCSGWRKDVVILCLEFAEHGGCSGPTLRNEHDSWKRSETVSNSTRGEAKVFSPTLYGGWAESTMAVHTNTGCLPDATEQDMSARACVCVYVCVCLLVCTSIKILDYICSQKVIIIRTPRPPIKRKKYVKYV